MAYNVYFSCDKCGITYNWINRSVGIGIAKSIARDKGWQIGKKGWFCPSCRTRTPKERGGEK